MIGYLSGFFGNIYLKAFNPQKAEKCFELALKYNTKNIDALYNYSIILLQKGQFEDALALLKKTDNLNKKVILKKLIILAMASCYWKLDNLDKAISLLENLKNDYEYINPESLTTLAYFYMLKKDYEKSLKLSNDVIKDNPAYASAFDNLGQIYFMQNDLKKAQEYFLKAISLNPNLPDSLYYLALIEESFNNTNKALEYLNLANNCNITALNTITKEDIQNKLDLLNV